jgi:ABC-2 type transport system ATP-binding protein
MQHLGRRRAKARAAELLERFGLADAGGRLVKTWSGGMRRRLDLIASLIVTPAVLFLDEPTTGLDPRSRSEIWSAVRSLAAAGTTVLLSTQYLEEADRIADQIVIIDDGRVTTQGSPDDLKNSLGSRVDVVLTDGPDIDNAAGDAALATAETVLGGITGTQPRVDHETRRLTAAIPAGAITLPELVRRLDAAGVEAEDVSIRRPTLDEVFLAETETRREAAA